MSLEKRKLRLVMKERLNRLSKMEYEQRSFEIAKKLFETKEWKQAKMIGITVSIFPEVDTFFIIRMAWLEGKFVAVPKCIPEKRLLSFRLLSKFTELEKGYANLYEPVESKTLAVEPEQLSLVIVPGLAFSKKGYRLGFGGGYYDRFLENFHGDFLSLSFESQIVTEIPTEPHDIRIGKIITEKDMYINYG